MQTTMRDFYTAIRSRLPAHQTHNNVTGKSNPGHFPLPPTTSPPPRGFNGTRAGHSYWYRLSDFFIHSSGALLGDKPNPALRSMEKKSSPVFKPCVQTLCDDRPATDSISSRESSLPAALDATPSTALCA